MSPKFRSKIISQLRRMSWQNPGYAQVRKLASRKVQKGSRLVTHYLCAHCNFTYSRSDTHVDHKKPIGTFKDWNTFIARLFCGPENLQVLCKSCHKKKTKQDRENGWE